MKRKIKSVLILLSILAGLQSKAQNITGQLQNDSGVPVPILFLNIQDSSKFIIDTTDSNGYYSTRVFDLATANIQCSFLNCDGNLIDTLFSIKTTNTLWSPDYCSPVIPPPPCPVSFTSSFCNCDRSFYLQLDTTGLGTKTLQWSFDDGNSSTEIFPTHYYSSDAIYNVCVTVMDSGFAICDFCHELGFDNSGHLVTREESSGFKIMTVKPGEVPTVTPTVNLSLYPNPVSDKTQVILFSDEENNYELKIMNLVGQEIQSIHKKATIGYTRLDLDLSTLQSGAYLLFVQMGDKNYSKLFVK